MELEHLLHDIRPTDPAWVRKAQVRTSQLVMPPRALGRLHDISERLCAIQETLEPAVDHKAFLVMAGDHGVAASGVSAFPQEVTGEMVRTFCRGGAGINVLARQIGARVWVVDMGIVPDLKPEQLSGGLSLLVHKVAPGTQNIIHGPAMSLSQANQSVLTGFQLATQQFNNGIELLGLGDMGIANTTASAAIGCVVTGCSVEKMVGRGTGVDDQGLQRKRKAVSDSLERNQPNRQDGLDVLSKVGGFEIGGIAGAIIAAAFHRRPVVVDGFISTAGALIAHTLCPAVQDYVFCGHCSAEVGHRSMLDHLGQEPIVDLGLRLGEGTGAALAMGVIESAVKVFREVMTFEQAGVSES